MLDNPQTIESQTIASSHIILASRGQRFGTYILDMIFLLGFTFIMALIIVILEVILRLGNIVGKTNEYVIGAIFLILYYIPQEALWGRTIGKFITGTKVVNADGTNISFNQAVGRSLCRLIPFDAFSFLGGNDDPIGWHDRIPKTRVISVRK